MFVFGLCFVSYFFKLWAGHGLTHLHLDIVWSQLEEGRQLITLGRQRY